MTFPRMNDYCKETVSENSPFPENDPFTPEMIFSRKGPMKNTAKNTVILRKHENIN